MLTRQIKYRSLKHTSSSSQTWINAWHKDNYCQFQVRYKGKAKSEKKCNGLTQTGGNRQKESKEFDTKSKSKLCPFTNVHLVESEKLPSSILAPNLKVNHFQLTFKKHNNIYIQRKFQLHS